MDKTCTAASGPAREGEHEGASPQSREERIRRLEALAELLRRGEYQPDFDALARALLEREPELFVPGLRAEKRKDRQQ